MDHPFFGLPETHIVIVGIIISKKMGWLYSCSRVVMIMVALMIIVRMVV